jgi:hypothetical protein
MSMGQPEDHDAHVRAFTVWKKDRLRHKIRKTAERIAAATAAELAAKKEYVQVGQMLKLAAEHDPSGSNLEEARRQAYAEFREDFSQGYFEENGVSRVRHVYPGVQRRYRVRKEVLRGFDLGFEPKNAEETQRAIIESVYIDNFWIPFVDFRRWASRHRRGYLLDYFAPPGAETKSTHSSDTNRPRSDAEPRLLRDASDFTPAQQTQRRRISHAKERELPGLLANFYNISPGGATRDEAWADIENQLNCSIPREVRREAARKVPYQGRPGRKTIGNNGRQ